MIYEVPYGDTLEIDTIAFDLNGTLSVKGIVPEGVKERIDKLKDIGFKLIVFTGNTRGFADTLCKDLGIGFMEAHTAKDKEELILKLNPEKCAAIGNARIDIGMFKHAKLSILTLQAEGIHTKAISHADIIVPSINDALDLFLDNDTMCSTLRE